MPLSKARNRDRMRDIRLHVVKEDAVVQPELPIMTQYNYHRFKPGDKVLVQRGKRMVETVIPELDGDGNPIYEEG